MPRNVIVMLTSSKSGLEGVVSLIKLATRPTQEQLVAAWALPTAWFHAGV